MKNASYMGANLFYHKSIHSKLYTAYGLNKTKKKRLQLQSLLMKKCPTEIYSLSYPE